MPVVKAYGDFYEEGSTARKKEYKLEPKKQETAKRRYGKNKINSKPKARSKVFTVVCILCAFTMVMVLTYRYNLISEKNLEVQNLKKQLATAEGSLLSAQIEVEQSTDLTKIEAYAKQQLGMQKPDKSQTIYIDTSNTTKTVETSDSKSLFDNIVGAIKNAINSIF